jgi:hypothetical protein
MPGEPVELGAVAAQVGGQLLLMGVEVFGPAQQPAGDLTDLQY